MELEWITFGIEASNVNRSKINTTERHYISNVVAGAMTTGKAAKATGYMAQPSHWK